MRCLRRIVDATWGLLSPGTEEVMLLHVPSGQILSDGLQGVRFPSVGDAAAFRVRYLDEAGAWKPIPVPPQAVSVDEHSGCAA